MKASVPGRADVVVVGAGVIGLTVAYELGRRGRGVLVLERAYPGSGATRAAAGMLAPTSEAETAEPALIDLALDSLRRYPRFVAELEALTGLSCQYRTEGTLWVALTRNDETDLDHLERLQREKGLAPQRLTGADVLEREPHLSGRVLSGLWVPDDHQVEPRALARCLEAAVLAGGGAIASGATVTGVETGAGRVRGVSGSGADGQWETACDAVVLAAGAWTGLAITPPVPGLGVRPVKGQLLRLRGPRLIEHVVRHPDVYLVPRRDGELVIGGTMEEQGYDETPTAGAALDLLRAAWRVLPGIYDLQFVELSVGLRPAVRDHLPVIGGTSIDGLFVATAHFRHGILLAPATGHYLAELIAGGATPSALAPFALARLADEDPAGRPRALRRARE